MPAVDPKTLELESCQLSMICTRVTSYGLGTEQGLGLGGTPRPEEKGRMCQNLTLGLSFDKLQPGIGLSGSRAFRIV